MCLQIIYLIYMYKEDLALNKQQYLIYNKTNQTITMLFAYPSMFFGTCDCLGNPNLTAFCNDSIVVIEML